jgi:hypothetical protein
MCRAILATSQNLAGGVKLEMFKASHAAKVRLR